MESTATPVDRHAAEIGSAGPSERLPLWRDIAVTVAILCRDPLGGVRAAERRVGIEAAGGVGLALGLVADVGVVAGVALLAGGIPLPLFVQLVLCGLAPLGAAALILSSVRRLTGRHGRLRRDLYVVGISAVPLGLAAIAVGLLGRTHGGADALTTLAASVLSVLLLFSGCRYVLRLSTLATVITVPLVVAAVATISAGLIGPLALMLVRAWASGAPPSS